MAYALTPLTVLLGSRESLLSVLTGIAPSSFNFLHRWLGRIMLGQALLHTFGWVLIEGRLYQPQPKTWHSFASEPYIIWGFVALAFLIVLCILSLRRVIHATGYEFFRKAHYILACLYFGACWAHWDALACWMIASLGLWAVVCFHRSHLAKESITNRDCHCQDRGLRLLRTALLHIGYIDFGKGEQTASSKVSRMPISNIILSIWVSPCLCLDRMLRRRRRRRCSIGLCP